MNDTHYSQGMSNSSPALPANKYNLRLVPTHYAYTSDMPVTEFAEKRARGLSAWSNKRAVPAIGERVRVRMNQMGYGVVRGFFVEEGFLGVYVALESPPDWFKKQNGRKHAMVFGAEIEVLREEVA